MSDRSAVSKEQWKLVVELVTRRLSKEAFCDSLSISVEDMPELGLRFIRQAFEDHDKGAVEFGLILGFTSGFNDGYLPVLLRLAGEDWHVDHENVASALDQLRAPSSVETLYALAISRHEYLDFDEAFALGVKCIWALGNIGSKEAIARLEDLLSCGNRILVENAGNQLFRLRDEAESEVVRTAAREALGRANLEGSAWS